MNHHLYDRHFMESNAMNKNFGLFTTVASMEMHTNKKQNVKLKLKLIKPPENIKRYLDFKVPHFYSSVFNLYACFLKVFYFSIQIFSLAEKIEPCPFKMQNLESFRLQQGPIDFLVKSLMGNHYRNVPRSAKKTFLEKIHLFLIPNDLNYFQVKEIILKMKYINFLTQKPAELLENTIPQIIKKK